MQVSPLLIKLAAFTVAMLPLLIENWRNATASNRSNAVLLLGGLAFAGYQLATGQLQASLWLFGGWLLVVAIALGLAALKAIPGGVAKTFAALAPWLSLGQFVAAVAVSMIIAAAFGVMRRKQVAVALPLYLTICAIWLISAYS